MKPSQQVARRADAEVSTLLEVLLKTGRRLEELTAGQVDTVVDRDGRTFLLRGTQEQLRSSEDTREAVVLHNQKALEAQNERLEVAVAARTSELAKAIEQLTMNNVELEKAKAAAEKASLAKSDFLSSMSHEIRTPMNAILGMADLLWESPLNAEQREYVGASRRAGASLLTLINAILDLSKIESGNFELHPVDFHLEDLVAAAEMLRVRAEGKGLKLAVQISSEVPLDLNGDAERLRQVLINLLGNAIKFTSVGEVRLDIGLEALPETVSQAVRFKISDTGPGIVAAKLALIFEPFTQADSTITRQYGGTGLGLTISRNLVELMGGKLEVSSENGKGSVFTFAIGLVKAGNPPVRIESALDAALSFRKTGMPRILLVDDSTDNRALIIAYLKHSAYDVETAADGQAAFNKFTARAFDLVLMDINMPVMDGHTATRKIREWETQQKARRVPILAVTAYAMESDLIRALEAGCDDRLIKPIKKATLLKALEEHLAASVSTSTEPSEWSMD